MANVKITELTALTDPASSDVLPIVDVGADTTKKVTIADLLENAGDGAAATPAFSFDNDKNTGIYRPGADQLALVTGGTARLTVSTSAVTSALPVDVLLGSASTPSFTFTGDLNTGIYSPGADQVAISTNGTGRLFIDSSGNIKLTSNEHQALAHKLTGYSASYGATTIGNPGNGQGNVALAVDLSAISGGTFVGTDQVIFPVNGGLIPNNAGNNYIGVFSRNSSDSLIIGPATSGGKSNGPMTLTSTSVGIGTSSPGSKLQVISTSAQDQLRFGYSTSVYTDAWMGTGFTVFDSIGGTGGAFDFRDDGTSRMFIDSSGNVGIAESSPSTHSAGTGMPTLVLKGNSGGYTARSGGLAFVSQDGGTTGKTLLYQDTDFYIQSTTGTNIRLYTNNTERLRIDSSGRLLVGTSSDNGGALLQVNGNRIRVATAKTPASASDTGTAGEICWDASYVYVCTATNTWKRAALSTW